jgi:hypothetical protein
LLDATGKPFKIAVTSIDISGIRIVTQLRLDMFVVLLANIGGLEIRDEVTYGLGGGSNRLAGGKVK